MNHKILGLKLAKREPIYDTSKPVIGQMIDDGKNNTIPLCTTENEKIADFFLKSIKERVHGKSWKIWKESK